MLLYIYVYTFLISFFNVSIPILRVDPDELSQLRRFFTKIFGKSPSVPRVSFPHGWTRRYALRKRWICESQGWIMADAVHRCKRGRGWEEARGERWLGRICETIIESVRARAYSWERRGRRKGGWMPGMGYPRNNPPRIVALFGARVHAEWVSYDDVMARCDDEQANFLSRA